MSKQKAENYAFPCSLIRANEKTLLTAQDLERVMDARDMQQAMHILAEFGYGDGRELTDPRGFEEVLAGEMNRVSELISSLSVDATEFALFRLPKDYHNLKVLLKAEALGIDPLPLMSAGGNFDPKQMLDMLRERNLIMLDLEMRQGLTDAAELYAKSGDPQEIDLVLDHACYAQMRRMAEAHENTFIRDYCELEVDLLNCRTFVRLREVGKPWEFFQKVFLQGGRLREQSFTGNYEEPYPQFAERVSPFGFGELFSRGAVEAANTGQFTLLEKLCDDRRMRFLKDAHYVTFGPEPIAAFYLAKESENKNLRMILTGKLVGTEPAVIKERLRETYV